MGNCCFGKSNTIDYKEENKFLKEKLIENQEKLADANLQNEVYRYQNIMVKAYYRNIHNFKNK